MLFCSQKVLVFFALVFAVYWALPWHRARVWLPLGASFYFSATWTKWLAFLICVSPLLVYLVARGMEWAATPGRRRFLLVLSLAANLALFAYFKYASCFLLSLE